MKIYKLLEQPDLASLREDIVSEATKLELVANAAKILLSEIDDYPLRPAYAVLSKAIQDLE